MDIKDFILIGGGLLIAMVVGHGFWIAWRAKREPLRMDIVPDLIPDDVDEIERLRGELPNGGARVIRNPGEPPAQEALELNVVLDGPCSTQDPIADAESSPDSKASEVELSAPVLMEPATEKPAPDNPAAGNPDANNPAPHKKMANQRPKFDGPKKLRARVHGAALDAGTVEPVPAQPQEPAVTTVSSDEAGTQRPQVREVQLELRTETRGESRSRQQATSRAQSKIQTRSKDRSEPKTETAPVEELLIVNLLAPRGQRFEGENLITALRNQGLRYGDMNIFHRIDPTTKAKLYSVANAVEPGTFDLSDLAAMRSPGMTFFLQLPGPDDASAMFEDMLTAARGVAMELGGELRDDDLSVLTAQTVAHMRQRIADFARRRLSKRA